MWFTGWLPIRHYGTDAKSYWISEEKRSAWGLLFAVVALNLGNVYISVRINEWNKAFYNALQKFDGGEFFRQLALFGVLASLYVIMAVYALYLNQMLQIRRRRWLTHRYLDAWLTLEWHERDNTRIDPQLVSDWDRTPPLMSSCLAAKWPIVKP